MAAASVFQSRSPSILAASSSDSLLLIVTPLAASASRSVRAMALASRKSRMEVHPLPCERTEARQELALLTRSLWEQRIEATAIRSPKPRGAASGRPYQPRRESAPWLRDLS